MKPIPPEPKPILKAVLPEPIKSEPKICKKCNSHIQYLVCEACAIEEHFDKECEKCNKNKIIHSKLCGDCLNPPCDECKQLNLKIENYKLII